MHPFVIGIEYERSQLLHFVGSRQLQTGVIWGELQPGCTIVTSGGRHGRKAGYFDERNVDGSWKYFGQGQAGNHSSSNAANKKLLDANDTILLFLTREPTSMEIRTKGNYRKSFNFQGVYNVFGYEIFTPDAGPRRGDNLFRFRLIPVFPDPCRSAEESVEPCDIVTLRNRLRTQVGTARIESSISIATYRLRSRQLRDYALMRARGKCEACSAPPTFLDDNGHGFLEVHHITRLADDGIDAPENVAAICPNCHRRAHYSADRADFRNYLIAAAKSAEEKVSALPGGKLQKIPNEHHQEATAIHDLSTS